MKEHSDTYFLRNQNYLEKIENFESLKLYKDTNNPQNYALIYIYPDGKSDRVLRTKNLLLHNLAIKNLYVVSEYLSKYITKKQASLLLHFEADEILAKKGVISIYFSSSDLNNNDTFGYMNLPPTYTLFQKKALLEFRKYLPYYEYFYINQ